MILILPIKKRKEETHNNIKQRKKKGQKYFCNYRHSIFEGNNNLPSVVYVQLYANAYEYRIYLELDGVWQNTAKTYFT